jgi:dihydrofolate synthase/folylpolyglutamate synthase
MYESDLNHSNPALEHKLRTLYDLRVSKALDLGFRPEYLKLLDALGNPHRELPPIIHVAGTNGKGSTVAILRALLEAQGKTAHVYTSPHLKRFNERIVIAGQQIIDDQLESLIDLAIEKNAGREATFFEITTAIAFVAFSQTPADFVLLETGLGGRLDCTNIIDAPIATIITPIALDHQEHLGHTLSEIAREKAGIMKQSTPCIIAPQVHATEIIDVLRSKAHETQSPLHIGGADWFIEEHSETQMQFRFKAESFLFPKPNLVGAHQIQNAGTALAALYILNHLNLWQPDQFQNALKRIDWPGRFQKIQPGPTLSFDPAHVEFWFDGGHNPHAAGALESQIRVWKNHDPKHLHLIFGMKGDKDAPAFLEKIAPHAASLTHIDIEDVGPFVSHETCAQIMTQYPGTAYSHATDPQDALNRITAHNPGKLRILLCGSLYLAKHLP